MDAVGRAWSSEINGCDRRLVPAHLLDQGWTRDIRPAQLGDDSVERHRAAQQEGVARMGGLVYPEAHVLKDSTHDGAQIRVGVHEQNPPAPGGGARGELSRHRDHHLPLVDAVIGQIDRAQPRQAECRGFSGLIRRIPPIPPAEATPK